MLSSFVSNSRQPHRLLLVYIFFSSLWILASDTLLASLIHNLTLFSQLQTLKGWIFVILSSSFIYRLIFARNNSISFTSLDSCIEESQKILSAILALVFILDQKSRYFNIISTQEQESYKKKQIETTLKQFAFHDSLTALPNQNSLFQNLEKLLKKESNIDLFAVVFIELNRFETIKYSLGHSFAEQLLVVTAQRIHSCLPHSEAIARVGDKSLAIILENITHENNLSLIVDSIHSHLNYPIELFEHELLSPVKIGIAFGGRNAPVCSPYKHPEEMLHAAATAMYYGSVNNAFRYTVFHPSMFQQAVARLQLETELRRSINQQQLQVYYQPIISLENGKITGFEALVRWQHPSQGLISPSHFLPLAEEIGFISHIDLWVMRESCKQLRQWKQVLAISEPLIMSVNFSGQLLSQVGLLEKIENIIVETGINGKNLKLEVVESVVMEQQAVAKEMLAQLRCLGIKLSIDDFGTGYSCLERLHSLPLDTLKIDRSFVQDMVDDEDRLEIVKTIVTLAHSLELDLIAEGIETEAQLEKLRSLGCEYGQGYYFSPPVNALSAEELLRKQYC